MQQKITYDEFPEKSKIDLIMMLPTAVTNIDRLKKRMTLLSIWFIFKMDQKDVPELKTV